MKALVFESPERPIVADVPMPAMKDTEVLVKSVAIGICHSDYELLGGRYIIPISYPVTPGHEWAGEIVEVGKAVKGYSVGDRVVGECVVRTPERLHHFGFSMDGADREYFAVEAAWLHKLPDAISYKTAAMIEPFTCGFYALQRAGGTNASETVVVSGGGPIGLVTAAAAVGMGARVIVLDPIASRRDVAARIGAEGMDPTSESVIDQVHDLTDGAGADVVIEASGHDASLANVFNYVREEGRVTMVGISIGRKVPVVLGDIQMKNLKVNGSIGSPGVWPAAIRFIERTGLDLSPIQTHDFPLERADEAFAFGKDPTGSIKITIVPE
ncbi:MAG: zinc-binding dehydrogenase [Hyphomicrobiales bacterium]|nr:zinc-binding dehydrogenase [Hyphomicrobiales bacterium]